METVGRDLSWDITSNQGLKVIDFKIDSFVAGRKFPLIKVQIINGSYFAPAAYALQRRKTGSYVSLVCQLVCSFNWWTCIT